MAAEADSRHWFLNYPGLPRGSGLRGRQRTRCLLKQARALRQTGAESRPVVSEPRLSRFGRLVIVELAEELRRSCSNDIFCHWD